MAGETPSSSVLRFGTFELNLRAGELHKQGPRVKLQEQPFASSPSSPSARGMSEATVESSGEHLMSEKQQVTKQDTQNPEAYELYLKGRYHWNKRTVADLETAISYFNQAIAHDPNYALAYSGLADAYSTLPVYGGAPSEYYPKGNAAARRAIVLDTTLAHPHAVLGGNEMEYEWDFAGGRG